MTWSASSQAIEEVSNSDSAFRNALIGTITTKYNLKPEQLQEIQITTNKDNINVQFHLADDNAEDIVKQIENDVEGQELKVSVATVGNAQYQYSATKASTTKDSSSSSGMSTSTIAIIAALVSVVVVVAIILLVIMKWTKKTGGQTTFQMLDDSSSIENPTYDANTGSINFK